MTNARRGFLLLEALVGIVVFGLFAAAIGLTLIRGQENTMLSGDRVRGVSIAEEALEASRIIRDGNFASLTAGAHGVELNPSGQWMYAGTQSTRSGSYSVTLTLTSLAADRWGASAESKWKHGFTRSGTVLLQTEITNWRTIRGAGNWSAVSLEGSVVDSGTPLYNDAAVKGNYAFVTSEASAGGAGLYVFDISTLTAPARVAATFNLGSGIAGYGVAVKGQTLYVVTSDPASEVRAYDITTPASLSSSNLLASYDLPGSSLGTSLALKGGTLFVGARQDATHNEFYSFNVANTGAITLLHSLNHAGSVNAVALSGTAAYLGTTSNTAEIEAVNIVQPSALAYPANSAYNLTDRSEDSLSVSAIGSGTFIGSQRGAIQEYVIVNTRKGGGSPPPSPGPWYHEGTWDLVGVDSDPAKCYGFIAAGSGSKALQVVNLRDGSLTELTTYTSTSGIGRGMFYDIVRDRIFLLTEKAFLIFKPTSSTNTCL